MAAFFPIRDGITLGELALQENCDLPDGGHDEVVRSVAPIENAKEGALTFLSNARYARHLTESAASFIVCSARHAQKVPSHMRRVVTPDPYRAYAGMLHSLYPSAAKPVSVTGETGVSRGAYVHPKAEIGEGVTLEHGATVGEGALLAAHVRVLAGAVVGAGVRLGEGTVVASSATVLNATLGRDCIVQPGVVIGADGFGYAMGPGGHRKVPQIGGVRVGDDVEIGAGATIDRGANRDTVIGRGTKIDNLVQVGHNVSIGEHCIIVALSGLAGSCTLEDFVVLGGQASVNGHVRIGRGAMIAGLGAVSEDVPAGAQYGGVPARPIKHWMREIAALRREGKRMERNQEPK